MVIVMNPIYENEIRQALADLNVETEVLTVEPSKLESAGNQVLSYK